MHKSNNGTVTVCLAGPAGLSHLVSLVSLASRGRRGASPRPGEEWGGLCFALCFFEYPCGAWSCTGGAEGFPSVPDPDLGCLVRPA